MRTKPNVLAILIFFSILIFNVEADPIAWITTHIETLIKTAKMTSNVMDVIGNYSPIFIEQFRSIFHKDTTIPERSYDFIVDLTRPKDIFESLKAYPISFPLGKDAYDKKMQEKLDRFVVNVVGRYNVGKTYVLRLLANIDLGHSFTERTIGVSVSLPSPKDTDGIPLALIDTAGTRTPVAYEDETFKDKSYQRQVSDSFIQEVAFNSAEVFVLVVNQLTLDDQLYLKMLTKRLMVGVLIIIFVNSIFTLQAKGFRERDIKQQLLIVHNYFNLQTVAEVERVVETELKEIFNATKNPQGYWLSKNFKHFVIANSNSAAGIDYNIKTIENIRTMIKGAISERNPNVLKRIVKEVELLLTKVLVEQKPDTPSNNKGDSLKPQTWLNSAIRAIWGRRNEEPIVSRKLQVEVKLKVAQIDIKNMKPLWFICPTEPLPSNIILSNDLGFNHDGSVYIDFSSTFVPDMNIIRLNDKGDIGIRIECPSCQNVTVARKGMTSILVRGEKLAESAEKQYLNTRRVGEFEMEISLDGLEEGLILNIGAMKTSFIDGVFQITVPSEKSYAMKLNDEL